MFGARDLYDAIDVLATTFPVTFPDGQCDCRMGDPMGHYLPQCPHPGQKIKFHRHN